MQTASKKVINGWAMFDWANSVYNLVITATIFPAYFEIFKDKSNLEGENYVTFLGRRFINSSLYNYTLGFALLIVAIILPMLTSIADYRGTKKRFMAFFLTMGSIACSCMFFFEKDDNLTRLWLGITCMVLACIGFWSSYVFSNSFLPEIAAPEDRDRISARGFAFGYVGSVILQVICFVFVLNSKEWFPKDGTLAARLSFLLVGIWWFGFGFYSLSRMPQPLAAGSGNAPGNIFSHGYTELAKVWKQIQKMPVIKRYLGA